MQESNKTCKCLLQPAVDAPNGINALEEFDRFCRFIDGMNIGGFVENDFMSKKIQAAIRAELIKASRPDAGGE